MSSEDPQNCIKVSSKQFGHWFFGTKHFEVDFGNLHLTAVHSAIKFSFVDWFATCMFKNTITYIFLFLIFRKDSFKVTCGTYLGRLTKIRIGHDNSGLGPGWLLNKASYFFFHLN